MAGRAFLFSGRSPGTRVGVRGSIIIEICNEPFGMGEIYQCRDTKKEEYEAQVKRQPCFLAHRYMVNTINNLTEDHRTVNLICDQNLGRRIFL